MIKTHIAQPVYFYKDKKIECRIDFTFKSPYLCNVYRVQKKKGEEEEKFVFIADKIKQKFPKLTFATVLPNYHIVGTISATAKCNTEAGDIYDKITGERIAESKAKIKLFHLLRRVNFYLCKLLYSCGPKVSFIDQKLTCLLVKELSHNKELINNDGHSHISNRA